MTSDHYHFPLITVFQNYDPAPKEKFRGMSILVVGSVAFDDVTSPSGSVKNILGGAATYFSLAASYFTKVRVVAVVGEDFGPEQENVFRQHGIDTRGIERAKGKTFRWG